MNPADNGYATTIPTIDGIYFDYLNPDPDAVTINAIARGLSNTCRFAGQCTPFYSVAEHSVRLSHIVPAELAVQGLLHDAAEAFMCDMPKPLKVLLPDYQRFEAQIEAVVFGKFGFSELHEDVKHADKVMLASEQIQLMKNTDPWKYTAGVEAVSFDTLGWRPHVAYEKFMRRAFDLGLGLFAQ